jgi:single-strand DNA-binding protein
MDYNKVLIIGRLGADPELKTNATGSQSMIFSVANSIYSKNQETGELVARTIWHKVTVWGDKLVQKCLGMQKGNLVLVEGYLDYTVIKKENSQTDTPVTIAKIVVSSYKQGRIEFHKTGGNTSGNRSEESGRSTAPSSPGSSGSSSSSSTSGFYGERNFREKKQSSDEFEEEGF